MKMTILCIGNSTLIPYLSPDNFGGRYLGFGVLCEEKYKWEVLQENLIIYSMQTHPKFSSLPHKKPRFPTDGPQDCWGRGKGSKYYFL